MRGRPRRQRAWQRGCVDAGRRRRRRRMPDADRGAGGDRARALLLRGMGVRGRARRRRLRRDLLGARAVWRGPWHCCQLRTKQQTGYIVHSGSTLVQTHRSLLYLASQSSHVAPPDLLERYETFLAGYSHGRLEVAPSRPQSLVTEGHGLTIVRNAVRGPRARHQRRQTGRRAGSGSGRPRAPSTHAVRTHPTVAHYAVVAASPEPCRDGRRGRDARV